MIDSKEYYSLLGIKSDATDKEIKKNYRLLANKFHPDKNSDPNAASKFIVITEAYDVLSNRKRRAQYDLMRFELSKVTKANKESFRTVVPPRESTRTRRNKAQQRRSLKYHQATSQSQKLLKLAVEYFIIISRYIPHTIGVILILTVLNSAVKQFSYAFELGGGTGVGNCVFIVALLCGLSKVVQLFVQELKKDMETFSILYRIPRTRIISASIYILISLVIVVVLRAL